uniref:PH domain-containing protein n=1 Tax=Globisporangium ultimum (strain ATCC 200006 / CBS 805.95 / DAOM BR144) TaxID=431595 RepID=K3WZU5_GLOUD
MSKEGFLIAHEEHERSAIYYCVLGEGRLQFFSRRFSGVLVRELTLTRSKLKIRGVPDEDARGCPFSFTVQLQRARIQDGRQIVIGRPELLVLSAPSWGERKAWGNAIHAWQRNYWGDPQHQSANMDDEELEAFFLAQHKALEGALQVAMEFSLPEYYSDVKRITSSGSNATSAASSQPNGSHNSSSNSARRSAKKKAAAAAMSRMLFSRAQAVKSMGSQVGKKIRATKSAVSFSLPPMGVSFASAAPQQPAH